MLGKLKNNIQDKLKGMAKDALATDEIAKTRLDICLACHHLYKPTGNCKICYCFVHAKTKLKSASCPIKKW